MAKSGAFRYLFLLISLLSTGNILASNHWDYSNLDWGEEYPLCNGLSQSPIALNSSEAVFKPNYSLNFDNYESLLDGNLTLSNNGHSIELAIPATINGEKPFISGGFLDNRYEAQSLHFHWGSPSKKGSEHFVDENQYDVEMHILHRNIKYATTEEAQNYEDGIAVVGIMLNMVEHPKKVYPGLNKIFNRLSKVAIYNSSTEVPALYLSQVLGELNTNNIFHYNGSLTTPPCSEVVSWFVFPEPLEIANGQLQKFFGILDSNSNSLLNNNRPLQYINDRPIYFVQPNYVG